MYFDKVLLSPFRTLLVNRHIISAFVRRDLHRRYVGSVMGLSWAILQPLALLALYTFVFSYILRIRYGEEQSTSTFGLYLFAGLLPWFAFHESLTRSTFVILENSNLIKKVVFPSHILPVYVVVSAILTELVGLGVLCLVVGVFSGGLSWQISLLPLVLVLQFLLTVGLSWLISSLNVFLRDVGQVLGLVMTTWLFLTPIFYPARLFPERYRFLLSINPMSYIVNAYRSLLLERQIPSLPNTLTITAMALVSFVLGYYFFRRSERAFVDVL